MSVLGPLLHRSVTMTFPSGFTVSADYLAEDRMRWRAPGGASGDETIHATRPSDDVVFVSWLEANGTTVSHAINVIEHTVASFVTFQAGKDRKVSAADGTWTFED